MTMYIYPDNLKAAPTLFLWRLKDLAVIGVGALISIFAMVQMGFSVPLAVTLAYAFLVRLETISYDDNDDEDYDCDESEQTELAAVSEKPQEYIQLTLF